MVGMLRGVADLDAAEWDSLARRGFHLHSWFRRRRAMRMGGPACGGPRAEWAPGPRPGVSHPGEQPQQSARPVAGTPRPGHAFAGVSLQPVISVQSPFALIPDPLGDRAELPPALLHRVFETLEARALADGAKAVAWAGVDEDHAVLLEVARERGTRFSMRVRAPDSPSDGARSRTMWPAGARASAAQSGGTSRASGQPGFEPAWRVTFVPPHRP